jgi:hypothetical protein
VHFNCSIVPDKHFKHGLIRRIEQFLYHEPLLLSLLLLLVTDLRTGEECSKTVSSPVNESGSGSEHYCDH